MSKRGIKIVHKDFHEGGTRVKDLQPRELFRYPSGSPNNVYMVLAGDCGKGYVHTVSLSSASTYQVKEDKAIIPVDGVLQVRDK